MLLLHSSRARYCRKNQYEEARIVTGLTRFVSLQNLYKEIGWMLPEVTGEYIKS